MLSDANVFVSSPALQGAHTATTDMNGVFYANTPTQTIFFGDRGSESFKDCVEHHDHA